MKGVHAFRGEGIHTSNSNGDREKKTDWTGKNGNKYAREVSGEIILRDFIEANGDLVDKEVLSRFRQGEKQAITESLNQIHWRSLKIKDGLKEKNKNDSLVVTANRSFAEVVVNPGKGTTDDCKGEWHVVNKKNKVKSPVKSEESTIFLVNIPHETKAKEVWVFFKSCGRIRDIILPMKRDKNGKRIGFIKTSNELEARSIINNAKEKGGLAIKVKMSINGSQRQREKEQSEEEHYLHRDLKGAGKHNQRGNYESRDKQNLDANDPGIKMFEYIEAEVDEEVEVGLLQSMVGFTWSDEITENLQSKISELGFDSIRVVGLSDRKFLLRNEASPNFC